MEIVKPILYTVGIMVAVVVITAIASATVAGVVVAVGLFMLHPAVREGVSYSFGVFVRQMTKKAEVSSAQTGATPSEATSTTVKPLSDEERAEVVAQTFFALDQGRVAEATALVNNRLLPTVESNRLRSFDNPTFSVPAAPVQALIGPGTATYYELLGTRLGALFGKKEKVAATRIGVLLRRALALTITAQSPGLDAVLRSAESGNKPVYDVAIIDNTMDEGQVEKIVETLAKVQADNEKVHVSVIATDEEVQETIHRVETANGIDVQDDVDTQVMNNKRLFLSIVDDHLPQNQAVTLNLVVGADDIEPVRGDSDLPFNLIIAQEIESLLRGMILTIQQLEDLDDMARELEKYA